MKRPPGIWFLLSAGVLWLSIQNVYGLKATELIFKRSTTTSTTESGEQTADEVATEPVVAVVNVTKSNFTGVPQHDYIYDPNLPRELNGYNLSSYPFYSSMPDNITFKCDGLHDGFYASIVHKCQVYHHCLSNIRYDFLCANYTAFDQRTFICQFVSEVDCNNSQKFWHRNDALYQATTTTTIKPTPIVISPALTASPKRPPPPIGRRRRPLKRRPQYEYYDDEQYDDNDKEDYYEEPPLRRRRKRPRPRPRPIYDDDYEEYDDRYERRSSGRRNKDRRHESEDNERHLPEKADGDKQEKNNDRKKSPDEHHYKDERRRDYDQDEEEDDDHNYRRRPVDKRRRKPYRRPHEEDVYDDDKGDDRHSQNEHTLSTPRTQTESDNGPLVKPHSFSSVFGQPRMPPRIKPPVPKSAQKTTSTEKPITSKKPLNDADYYEDYEEVPLKTTTTKAPEPEISKRPKPRTTRKPAVYDDDYEDDVPQISLPKRPNKEVGTRYMSPKFVPKENRSRPSTTTATTTTTTEPPRERLEPIVRVVKRPFLPSRGGNPYSIRGLQPVGAKALDTSKYETDQPEIVEKPKYEDDQPRQNGRQFPSPNPIDERNLSEELTNKPSVLLATQAIQRQTPARTKFIPTNEEQVFIKSQIPENNPLDITDSEYDVTLNDALNPTIPNLPIRNFHNGFGTSSSNYIYSPIQRPQYDDTFNQPPQNFQQRIIKQRDERVVAQQENYQNQDRNQNFRPSPQVTQAHTRGFYNGF